MHSRPALILKVNQAVLEANQGGLEVAQMWPRGVAADHVQELHSARHLTNGPGDVVAVPFTHRGQFLLHRLLYQIPSEAALPGLIQKLRPIFHMTPPSNQVAARLCYACRPQLVIPVEMRHKEGHILHIFKLIGHFRIC